MWIASKVGFFSIVKFIPGTPGTARSAGNAGNAPGRTPGKWIVRARRAKDLEAVADIIEETGDPRPLIHHSPDADYCARVFVDKMQLTALMEAFGDTVDYPNFKDEIHANVEQAEKYRAYTAVWDAMRRYQLEHGAKWALPEKAITAAARRLKVLLKQGINRAAAVACIAEETGYSEATVELLVDKSARPEEVEAALADAVPTILEIPSSGPRREAVRQLRNTKSV